MRLSYKVGDNWLIKSALLPLDGSKVTLIAGSECQAFHLLGGILGKLFPIRENLPVEWAQMRELLLPFTGEVVLEDGSLPESCSYVGIDPDRHLFFSKVKEELTVQIGDHRSCEAALSNFGLDPTFLDRRISSLSGGEKMRVSLALAFSKAASCYILHGVIPWLDRRGRQMLRRQILHARGAGADVVLFEHEISALENVVDNVIDFDGLSTKEIDKTGFFAARRGQSLIETRANALTRSLMEDADETVRFQNVSLHLSPYYDSIPLKPLLDQVSFSIQRGQIYGLVGDNGAGKSTIAQITLRVIKPDTGGISIMGQPLSSVSREDLSKLICYVGQFPERQITLSDIGSYRIQAGKLGRNLSLKLLDKFLPLPDDTPVCILSYLQIKLLCLAARITEQTRLVILDEPTWGLDLEGQATLIQVLIDIAASIKYSLLMISHDLGLIRHLGAHVLWLHGGHVTLYNSLPELESDPDACEQFGLTSN